METKLDKIIIGDKKIFWAVVVLLIFSALIMSSAFTSLAMQNRTFGFSVLKKQLLLGGMAFALMIFVSKVPYQIYSNLSYLFLGGSAILLLMTFVMGVNINSAYRWFKIPIIGITLQTSELVKVSLVIVTAKIISEYDPNSGDVISMFKKVAFIAAPFIILIAINDLSTAILIGAAIFIMLFFTNVDIKVYLKIMGVIVAIAVFLFLLALVFKVKRAETWINRLTNTENVTQKTQALVAISQAPLLPQPGSSKQKFVVANNVSDYIFSIIVEEYGYAGAILILLMYAILLYRISLIIKKQKRTFPLYLSIGFMLNLFLQALMHILVNVGIFPVTGQPLPFISLGGTAMLTAAFQIAVILNISYQSEKQDEQQSQTEIKQKNENLVINDHAFIID